MAVGDGIESLSKVLDLLRQKARRQAVPVPGRARDWRPVVTAQVAALFVDPKGPYFSRPDVDPWDESRDARRIWLCADDVAIESLRAALTAAGYLEAEGGDRG